MHPEPEADVDEQSEDDGDIEGAYFARSRRKELAQSVPSPPPKKPSKAKKAVASEAADASDAAEDKDDGDDAPPQHESLASTSTTKRVRERVPKSKSKYTPPDETKEQRDARTIFIGNLPVEIIKSQVRNPEFVSQSCS